MQHNPTPPHPLPSRNILKRAKTHYTSFIEDGGTRSEYALAALKYFLQIIDEERKNHDSQTSLHWSIEAGYTDVYHHFLRLYKTNKDSFAFNKLNNAALEFSLILQNFKRNNRYFKFDDLSHALSQCCNASELDIFVEERMNYDRDPEKWWTSSINTCLEQLVRQVMNDERDVENRFKRDDEFPYFYAHKIFTIMAIHRQGPEFPEDKSLENCMTSWLDWQDTKALEEADTELAQFCYGLNFAWATEKA